MKKIFSILSTLIMVIVLSVPARAALVDMGDGTVYDTDLQISWLKDAGMGGKQEWEGAVDWAEELVFAGFDNWRLPIVTEQIWGYNITGSEMGHLYYVELGNQAGMMTNAGPFMNISGPYWSGTEDAYDPEHQHAWGFCFNCGNQYSDDKYDYSFVWAVRPGERTVPHVVVDPAAFDFGSIIWGNQGTTVVSISNSGEAEVIIEDISIEGSSAFSVSVLTELPAALTDAQVLEAVITCTPSTLYKNETAALLIMNDDPEQADQTKMVPLSCTGVLDPIPSTAIQQLLAYIELSVSEETLSGLGPGGSAENRLNSFIDMMISAGQLIESGNTADACNLFNSIYRKVDGAPKPSDLVTGEAAPGIAAGIVQIMTMLQCN